MLMMPLIQQFDCLDTHTYIIYNVDVTDIFSFKKIPVLTTVLMCSMYIEMI